MIVPRQNIKLTPKRNSHSILERNTLQTKEKKVNKRIQLIIL